MKGFLPNEEAEKLREWATLGAQVGPLLEIGSYCGLSTLHLAGIAREANTVVFAVDHHRGSEEHQVGEFFHDDALTMIKEISFTQNSDATSNATRPRMSSFRLCTIDYGRSPLDNTARLFLSTGAQFRCGACRLPGLVIASAARWAASHP